MAYSASAPTLLYAQVIPHGAYYERVTRTAQKSVKGCPEAVRRSFADYLSLDSKESVIRELGICDDASSMPRYIAEGGLETLQKAINMVLMYTFAGLNMENYPPNNETGLYKACSGLVAQPTLKGLKAFLSDYGGSETASGCFNLTAQLPSGHLPTITGGDWSGVGPGNNGESWDYETCTLLIERPSTHLPFPNRMRTSPSSLPYIHIFSLLLYCFIVSLGVYCYYFCFYCCFYYLLGYPPTTGRTCSHHGHPQWTG